MILVTGATGNVGSVLTAQLCDAGVPTRALVRTPETADNLRGFDCEIAVGDFTDPSVLDEALRGVDALYLLTPASSSQVDQERTIIDAAARTGGVRVVKHAVLGYDGGIGRFGDNHARSIEHLRGSGLPHTVLAPNSFMQNLLRSAALVQQQSILPYAAGDAAISHVDVRDVAAVAAHVLTSDGHDGATYEITGAEALSYAEVVAQLSELLGREIRYVDAPPDQAREAMSAGGMPAWTVDAFDELFAAYRDGQGAKVTGEVQKATSRPACPLSEFLADHRAAFA